MSVLCWGSNPPRILPGGRYHVNMSYLFNANIREVPNDLDMRPLGAKSAREAWHFRGNAAYKAEFIQSIVVHNLAKLQSQNI